MICTCWSTCVSQINAGGGGVCWSRAWLGKIEGVGVIFCERHVAGCRLSRGPQRREAPLGPGGAGDPFDIELWLRAVVHVTFGRSAGSLHWVLGGCVSRPRENTGRGSCSAGSVFGVRVGSPCSVTPVTPSICVRVCAIVCYLERLGMKGRWGLWVGSGVCLPCPSRSHAVLFAALTYS